VPLGLQVARIDLTSSLPHAAQAAFDAVLTADQTVERQLAQAQTAAAQQQQQASAAVSTILNTAHARADERLAQARNETSEILALAPRMQQPDGQPCCASCIRTRSSGYWPRQARSPPWTRTAVAG
jgi:hypothetical protein